MRNRFNIQNNDCYVVNKKNELSGIISREVADRPIIEKQDLIDCLNELQAVSVKLEELIAKYRTMKNLPRNGRFAKELQDILHIETTEILEDKVLGIIESENEVKTIRRKLEKLNNHEL